MSQSLNYVSIFRDDKIPKPDRLREIADALDRILLDERPSPSGWSHAELFAPYYIRCYAEDLDKWNRRAGDGE